MPMIAWGISDIYGAHTGLYDTMITLLNYLDFVELDMMTNHRSKCAHVFVRWDNTATHIRMEGVENIPTI